MDPRNDMRSQNRRMVEEAASRKANVDTHFFWTQVAKNQVQRQQGNKKSARLREEQMLFSKHQDASHGMIEDSIPVERSGPRSDEISALTNFEELKEILPAFMSRNIDLMKYAKPTPIQKHAIPLGLAGLDLMCCAQTVRVFSQFC